MATIQNINKNAQLNGTSENDNIYNSGTYASITSNAGNDSIDNTASHVYIQTDAGDDRISNRGRNFVTIKGGDGEDTIESYSGYSLIEGEAGNDNIYTYAGYYVTVDGGDGDDTIFSTSQRTTINGGNGDDIVIIEGNSTTINSGAGNDTITGSNRYMDTFQYDNGGGDDVVTNFKANDLVHISSGQISSVTLDGSDFIFKVGSGSLTLKNVLNTRIRVKDERGLYSYYKPTDYLAGAVINDASVSAEMGRSGYNFGDDTTVTSGDGYDMIINHGSNVLVDAKGGNDTLTNYGENSTLEGGDGDDSLRSKGNSVLLNGGEGRDFIYNGASHCDSVTISGGAGNDSITNYGKYSIVNADDGDDFIFNGQIANNSTLNGGEGNDTIRNNNAYDVSIIGGTGDDSIYTNGVNVTVNAGTGNDTLQLATGKTVVQYADGDGDLLVYGFKVDDTLNLTSGIVSVTAVNSTDVILYIGSGTITLKNYKDKKVNFLDPAGVLTHDVYDGGQNYNLPDGVTYNYNKTAITVSSPFEGTLDLNNYKTVKSVDARHTPNAVELIGNDNANTFRAGDGGSTMTGGAGRDALFGGAGVDLFIYSKGDGHDTIYKYTSGEDTIQLSSDTVVSNVTIRGTSVILNFEDGGSLTIANSKDKEITIIDPDGETGVYTFSKAADGLISTSRDTVTSASYIEKYWFTDDISDEESFNESSLQIDLDSLIQVKNDITNSSDDLNLNFNFNESSNLVVDNNFSTKRSKDFSKTN